MLSFAETRAALKAVYDGEIITVEGHRVSAIGISARDMRPGDRYIAGRNTGLKLLTCREVVTGPQSVTRPDGSEVAVTSNWVSPQEPAQYAYDLGECVPVEVLD